ncbi:MULTISPECIES: class I SAM-dependent methyltransferase [Amycolatopsis]|uniref:class I SAM-dependent methyltransferase n=1 Tax=Amycolatopsis TaxID=1813 RepID=UPI000F7A0816|nr:class I SAM-dependent methyltransferase [Amycolatopsis sp. WAC 04197]RSN47470.1 SAM-dependent methyltransferase [Amycolatopsis sp. WAC 04197]
MNSSTPGIEPELHARRAASFGAKAADYAAHRPDYPEKALAWGLAGAAGAPERVLDLAAGTGKVSEGLLALGVTVTAVEPDEKMLAELTRTLPAVTPLIGTAEEIPLPDGAVDAVVVGQAVHWFDLDRAYPEMARVLRPGGVVAALWNHDDESAGWLAELNALIKTSMSRRWLSDYESLPRHEAFEPFEKKTFGHKQPRTAETLVATLATHSHILVAPAEEREAKLRTAREFLDRNPETASGEFDLPITTTVFRARKR